MESLLIVVFFALFFVVARFFCDEFLFRKMARWLVTKGNARFRLDRGSEDKVAKCSESMWKFAYYSIVEACVLGFNYRESWFWNKNEYFEGWPNQELKVSLKMYYMGQCGFYLYSIIALQLWETRRKDFSISMSHHLITVTLIGYSYFTRLFRIGTVTLALHDASDVLLEAAKIFKYSDHDLSASVCFGLFAVSWFTLRLVLFPFFVIRASSYDFVNFFDLSKTRFVLMYYVFNTMLLMLLVFHVYWWILICAMIAKQLKNNGKVGEDIRSDSEDDDE